MSSVSVYGVEIDTRHFIGGKRLASIDTYANTSPIDGSFLGDFARGGPEEVNQGISHDSRRVRVEQHDLVTLSPGEKIGEVESCQKASFF